MSKIILLLSLFAAIVSSTTAYADAGEDLAAEKALSQRYMDLMTLEEGATVVEPGVVLRPIFQSQSGIFPLVSDQVSVVYHLVDREGKVVDESVTADEMLTFPLSKLIKCWQIALPKMSVGSYYKVSCSSDVAYGDKGAGDDIKPGAALTFRIALYDVKK